MEESMREELAHHLACMEDDLVSQGMPRAKARQEARRAFGHEEGHREACRDQRRWVAAELFWGDCSRGLRQISHRKLSSFVIVATLALALACLGTVLDVSRQVFLPNMGMLHLKRLIQLSFTIEGTPGGEMVLNRAQYAELSARTEWWDAIATHEPSVVNMVVDGNPCSVQLNRVTPGFVEMCGLAFSHGRGFTQEEQEKGDPSVVIINHYQWRHRFGARPDIIGARALIDGTQRTIVGVLANAVRAPYNRRSWDVLVPVPASGAPGSNAWDPVFALARLRPGIQLDQMDAGLATVSLGHLSQLRDQDYAKRLRLAGSALEEHYHMANQLIMWPVLGASLLLLIIAALNCSTLLLIRIRARRRELAVRLALGATPGRLTRLLIMEHIALCLFAAALACLLATWANQGFVSYVNHWWFGPVRADAGWAMGLTLAASIPCTALVSLLPLWRAQDWKLGDALKEGAGTVGQGPRTRRWLNATVFVQATLAVMLLAGALLLERTLSDLRAVDLGYKTDRRLAVHGTLPVRFGTPEEMQQGLTRYLSGIEALRDELARLPGVERVVFNDWIPLTSWFPLGFQVGASQDKGVNAMFSRISPEYFDQAGIPILQGTGFTGISRNAEPCVVIDELIAKACFGDQNPVGQWLDVGDTYLWGPFDGQAPRRVRMRVAGVAAKVRSIHQRTEPAPIIYFPYWVRPPWDTSGVGMILSMNYTPSASFETDIRRISYRLDPRMTFDTLRLDDEREWKLSSERYALGIFRLLATLALFFTLIGLYAVMSEAVGMRTREFGLRLALGADGATLARSVLRSGLVLALAGLCSGLLASRLCLGLMAPLLLPGTGIDWVLICLLAAILFVGMALACWIPARRAARIDPMTSLRCE